MPRVTIENRSSSPRDQKAIGRAAHVLQSEHQQPHTTTWSGADADRQTERSPRHWMGVYPYMSDEQSQQNGSSPAKKLQAADTEATAPQQHMKKTKDNQFDEEYVLLDASEATSPRKKRRRSRSGGSEQAAEKADGLAVSSIETEESEESFELNGRTDGEKDKGEGVANGAEQQERLKNGEQGDLPEKKLDGKKRDSEDDAVAAPPRVPSPAVHVAGGDMVFPDDEEPIELCLFSSDGSAENTPTKPPPPPRKKVSEDSERKEERPSTDAATTTPAPIMPTSVQSDTAPTTRASVTAEDAVTQNGTSRAVGKRKRRKKLVYSSSRKREAAKTKQDGDSVPTSPALEDKLSISVNGHATENGGDADSSGSAPPSPVYPDADASHLYPSTPEGAPWRWEDVDPYFDPLAQSDLDNIVRWRKENANFIAANPTLWRELSGIESKRAVLETMLGDASDAITDRIEYPIRRGRCYRDVWEEKYFLTRQKRLSSVGDPHPKAQVVQLKKKRKGAVDGERLLLESHRNLVYGYDDDLFQEFRARLEGRVKASEAGSPPDTPPVTGRRQQSSNTKVDDGSTDASVQEVVFDEEVLPSFPSHQLHPASLGLWKLRKNQDPDFAVVHPASVNRSQTPARWREEMKRHHQQQFELQLQQTDEMADPSDGDDEGTGDSTQHPLRAFILNSEVTGGLPSFGECLEEDEISQTLAASVRKLVALSMYNWRTAQRVHERAECSIQCAPILEGEAAAARELENVYLQLCPPGVANEEPIVLPGTEQAPRPRTAQINSAPHDVIAYSVRRDIAENCSLAVAASVEFALGLHVGDVVDVLDRNGCWNYGEVVETYSEGKMGIAKFLLMRFSLWSEDAVEWIAASEGRLLPRGVADGSRPCSVGPTQAHRVRVRYDQSLARELEISFPQRQAKQVTAASQMLAHRQHIAVTRATSDLQKTPQKRKRKRPAKAASVASTV
jgi:hypothetical protein